MPELPEVETVRRRVERLYLGREITAARPGSDPQLRRPIPPDLPDKLTGGVFAGTHRHGKFLFLRLQGSGWLVLHLGMTGRLADGSADQAEGRFARFMVEFADGGRITFADPRKFGELAWTADPAAFMTGRGYGPDAMDPTLTAGSFAALLSGRRTTIKSALLDQSIVAGVGNLYADEILYQMHLPPRTRVVDLTRRRILSMHAVMRRVLTYSIGMETDFARFGPEYLLSVRQDSRVCPRCGSPLDRTRVAGRGTWYCPRCQPG